MPDFQFDTPPPFKSMAWGRAEVEDFFFCRFTIFSQKTKLILKKAFFAGRVL